MTTALCAHGHEVIYVIQQVSERQIDIEMKNSNQDTLLQRIPERLKHLFDKDTR